MIVTHRIRIEAELSPNGLRELATQWERFYNRPGIRTTIDIAPYTKLAVLECELPSSSLREVLEWAR